ncbi:MAG TPA: hypothetical protein ENJ28_01065 [Gammaproteobacteria bacterium]|nr:hypothetical protein [Gammaproteobacteria bacterium]
MDFNAIKRACTRLNYQDKLRLAQYLTQAAKAEAPIIDRSCEDNDGNVDDVTYVRQRLVKLRPKKKKAVMNSIRTMFQLQGGISEEEIEVIINELEYDGFLTVVDNKIIYT